MKIEVLLVVYQFYSFQLILSFWIDFSAKLVQIMTQEFAKNTNSRTTWNDSPPFFTPKKQKKLAFFFFFVLSSFSKKKQFPIISPFKRSLSK
ncbi:MAG: hypothetical protein KGI30_02440, partial [Planctomycetota bacterium]|nr:hypothetical protein [Planctomycetota bacterium]